jgi:signal transduction histidine kinase
VPVNQKKTSAAREEQNLFLRVSQAFFEGMELSCFLNQVLTVIVEQLAAAGAYLCLHCQEKDVLSLEAVCPAAKSARPPSISLSRTVKPGSLWRKVVRRPNPLLITHAATDRRVPFRDLLSPCASQPLLLLPLASGDDVLGLLGIMVPDADVCTPEKIELATVLAQPAVLAANLARTIDRAIRAAVLQERSRMARDLHDTLVRGFTGVLMHMELAEEILHRDRQGVLRHIASARRMAREGVEEAHRAIFAIHPRALAKQRLAGALQQLTAELTRDTRIRATFSLCGAAPMLAPEVELQLLRIAQEALTNILRHADATTAHIELVSGRDSVHLNIQDDGHGLKRWTSRRAHGLGLLGMTKRARQMGGSLVLLPREGRGIQIQVNVPLKMKLATREECT